MTSYSYSKLHLTLVTPKTFGFVDEADSPLDVQARALITNPFPLMKSGTLSSYFIKCRLCDGQNGMKILYQRSGVSSVLRYYMYDGDFNVNPFVEIKDACTV
jgi:hypothetical protein